MDENRNNIEAFNFLVNTPKLDLRTFERSKHYHNITSNIDPLNLCKYCDDIPIIISGDIKEIIITNKNEIFLFVLYDVYSNNYEKYAKVKYTDQPYIDFIRKNVLPMTQISIKSYFTNVFTEFKGSEILSFNEPLYYGHYVCPKCGYDYGIGKDCKGQYCDICEDDNLDQLKYVTDYYEINT